ncbi:hypothetical protein J2R98_001912 [Alkalibacillus filiformis]|uniref:Uncharacterized protein n=1 Tax=Alkalibacillus filiformis TaxID=200990 RepID=A0ABU0DUV3_9BACI|nr:hypothetical protein [Alkalibacillus filiformis]MDQ0352078.1 hypothetical protein [Alkalibacillus filiformis]
MKAFAKVLIWVGILSVLIGLIPVIFVYPNKDWDSVIEFVNYTVFVADERLLWQVGTVIWLFGIWRLRKERKKGRIFY